MKLCIMKFSEEILKKTIQFGVLCYPVDKALNLLEFDNQAEKDSYRKAFRTPNSSIAQAYAKGNDMRDFAFDTKLFEMAKAGDVKAMQEFEKRREKILKVK